jgi:hypothetical protein
MSFAGLDFPRPSDGTPVPFTPSRVESIFNLSQFCREAARQLSELPQDDHKAILGPD